MSQHPPSEQPDSAAACALPRRFCPSWAVWSLGGLLLAAAGWMLWNARDRSDQWLADSRSALLHEEYETAHRQAVRVLARDPDNAQALLLAGLASAALGNRQEALDHWDGIPDDGSDVAVEARFASGDLLLREAGRLSPAEREFRRVLEQNPQHLLAHDRLVYLLGVETRGWDMVPHQLELVRAGQTIPQRLYLLSLGERLPADGDVIRKYRESAADDPGLQLALATQAISAQRTDEAQRLLRSAVDSQPDLIEAQVRLGQLLVDRQLDVEFRAWHAALPAEAEAHPGLWAMRGDLARRRNESMAAARCYWEAVRRNPCHQRANYQLGQVLVLLDRQEQADPFLSRAERLQAYVNAVYTTIARADASVPSPAEFVRLSQQAKALGLLWESAAWELLARENDPRPPSLREQPASWPPPELGGQPLVRTVPEANPALAVDLSDYELPDWSSLKTHGAAAANASAAPAGITFEDRAAGAGLDFVYLNGGEPLAGLMRVYEFTGGGAAVLDYDGDGWPDVYLTQAGGRPGSENCHEHRGRLFRNLGDGRFAEVAVPAALIETGYGQGAAVGDFNNDGFPDLYIANFGRNAFYENNGDGTFSEITDATGTGGDRWTTSCVIADFNGDGLPDLYAVNYLSLREALARVCRDEQAVRQSCLPQNFSAAQDQIYLNRGDGRFEEVTATAGIVVPNGKGLGIVAADFEGTGLLNLFVANDAVPNFYFVNETLGPGARPQFAERALPTGLAFAAHGGAEACMGIAAGDADGDGLIDLFVTNFTEESNTLYRQVGPQLFVDATTAAGLGAPSVSMLGFGTQFVDGNLDGNLDLIVTNGHVDDYREFGLQYQMPPQYFRNVGQARFTELAAGELGAYFEGRYLGRGMARLDWNRDGRDDVVISHLDAPAALLTNTTEPVGRFLTIHLRGVASARDAIGATVTATVVAAGGRRMLVRQLTAGDGYQASNQRSLVFGLGDRDRIERLQIRWPTGRQQEFVDLASDRELLFIEGRSDAVDVSLRPEKTSRAAEHAEKGSEVGD